MKSVNIAELKNRLSLYLNDVKSGEEILVKDRDLPIARIIPFRIEDQDEELAALVARGKLRIGQGSIGDDFWDLPAPNVAINILRQAIEEERDDAL